MTGRVRVYGLLGKTLLRPPRWFNMEVLGTFLGSAYNDSGSSSTPMVTLYWKVVMLNFRTWSWPLTKLKGSYHQIFLRILAQFLGYIAIHKTPYPYFSWFFCFTKKWIELNSCVTFKIPERHVMNLSGIVSNMRKVVHIDLRWHSPPEFQDWMFGLGFDQSHKWAYAITR